MGVVDHFSDYFDCSHGSSKLKKRRQLQVSPFTQAPFFFFFWLYDSSFQLSEHLKCLESAYLLADRSRLEFASDQFVLKLIQIFTRPFKKKKKKKSLCITSEN